MPVQHIHQLAWDTTYRQVPWQIGRGFGQQLVNKTCRKRLCLIDKDELLAMGVDIRGDEPNHGYNDVAVLRARKRERTLLAVNYPCRLLALRSQGNCQGPCLRDVEQAGRVGTTRGAELYFWRK